MDADSVAEAVFGLHPDGPMAIHVVDHDYEYWLEVTAVKSASLVEPPWTGGVIIETKPIPAGVMARRPIMNPRPYFRTPNTPLPTPAERLHDLQAEGALDFIPAEDRSFSTPVPTKDIAIPDPHYGRPPTIDDIATKSPEQLAQMYPNGIAGVYTSETDNLQPPTTDIRFQQYRDPFPGKSYARMELAQHGQLPETGWRYENAPEFQGAGTEHLAEELGAQHRRDDNVDQPDLAEPHYSVAREINEKEQS